MILQRGTSQGGPARFLGPVVSEEFDNADIELPDGWCSVLSPGSRVYRPRQRNLPSVKVHYARLMVDVDFKIGRDIASKRIPCKTIAELLKVTQDQLWEWS